MLIIMLFLVFGLPILAFIASVMWGLISTWKAAVTFMGAVQHLDACAMRAYVMEQERVVNVEQMAEET